MGFKRRFILGLLWRVMVLLLAAFLFVWSLSLEGLGAARLLAALLCAGAIAGLWRFIQRTNVELARFVDAVRFGDFSQNFTHRHEGSGFSEFGEALEEGMRRLRDERLRLSDDTRFFEAVLDDAPTALLTIDAEGKVELANKAARRLLVRHSGVRIEDFAEYGDAFAKSLADASVGRPRLVPLTIDSVPQTAMISAALVHRLGSRVRVVAIQPIQGELNAVEIAAQSDLVRVLTHEIMNSMTPVTSLAQTAAGLMAEVDKGDDRDIADARAAVETLARRADGVMHFVESYRQISRTPEIRRRVFEILPWARELEALFRAGEASAGVTFALEVSRDDLTIDADPDLLAQVLINLMRNAAEAARAHSDAPAVSLSFAETRSRRVQIEVADNGPGVPETLRHDIFLPFFTTKEKGTGVGLSLARQIVLGHRGSIDLATSEAGGALFRILI
ncbi:sensor histidine kinase [Sphingosinicella humi]|uniref:histidine kinase n=1 Tax=Allosphingosinicella humi TaxID=2068657 RepID=A0A2U2J2Y3_9SPHN|nr:ATP-binding protein [Sphingosinicella humi]PWG02672.1 ATP-binding protein [Sphingosinicella humi]